MSAYPRQSSLASAGPRRPRAGAGGFEHGRARAGDRGHGPIGEEPPQVAIRGRRPGGLALVGLLALVVVAGLAALRVRTQARILELGAAISDETAEHARLVDDKRRLEAERAYLRHPEHVARVATQHLGMERPEPEAIQRIRVQAPATEGEERSARSR